MPVKSQKKIKQNLTKFKNFLILANLKKKLDLLWNTGANSGDVGWEAHTVSPSNERE